MSETQPKDYEVSTKKPSRWAGFRSWVNPIAASLILLIIGAIITYFVQVKQKKLETYSKLMGQRVFVAQFFVWQLEASAFLAYYQRKWELDGKPSESYDFKEFQRRMHREEDVALEFLKSRKDLYEILGSVRSYFSKSECIRFVHMPPGTAQNLRLRGGVSVPMSCTSI
jgi:hypothetical protein